MKRTAFISHSSKDKAVAEAVCNFLERNGISCWIAPRDVTPGKNYGVAIVDAIDECGVFVIILTGESNKSGQVVREVERAASANSVIIPLRVELVQPSRDLEFYVSSSHWLDASEKPLDKHLDSLVDAIRDWQTKSGMLTPAKVEPRSSVARPAPQSSKLPMITGIAVAALAIIGLAIFLAKRPSPLAQTGTQSPAVASASQSEHPRMGRRRGAREQAKDATGAPNPAETAAETSASGAPNENVAPGAPPVIDRVVASSERPSVMYEGQLRHFEAAHAVDGDIKTVWIPNGSGPGESIEVFFKSPTAIGSVSILGGVGADAERFLLNNRVQEIRMTYPNGFSRVLKLEDKMEFQSFKLPREPVLRSMKFEIVSVYHGSKNDATPIAEIEFNRPE